LNSKTQTSSAFYEVVFVKLQYRRRVDLSDRRIGDRDFENWQTDEASLFLLWFMIFAWSCWQLHGSLGILRPEQPSIRAGEEPDTTYIIRSRALAKHLVSGPI
jgi:hypothetical protein